MDKKRFKDAFKPTLDRLESDFRAENEILTGRRAPSRLRAAEIPEFGLLRFRDNPRVREFSPEIDDIIMVELQRINLI